MGRFSIFKMRWKGIFELYNFTPPRQNIDWKSIKGVMEEKPAKARKFSHFGGAKGVRGEFYFYFLWCILVSWMEEPIHGKKSRELRGPSLDI